MADFNTSLQAASLAVLRRDLTDDERMEFLELAAALGMESVEDYIYMLMIFKRNEDRLSRKFEDVEGRLDRKLEALDTRFEAISALETRIVETLELSVERILGEGARRIGCDMGDEIAAKAKELLSAVAEYHRTRGQVILAAFVCAVSAISYCIGRSNIPDVIPEGGISRALLIMPAGWCFVLCGITYSFFWVGDNWFAIRRSKWYKAFLGIQLTAWLSLAVKML